MPERYQFDFLVIGSGIAGLTFALRVANHGSVALVTKKESVESNTNYAQGGIAAVMDAADSFEQHVQDTLEAGAGLCDREVVETVVREGPERIRELIALGAQFTYENGRLHLGREGGHSRNRIVHAADATGREVERTLLAHVRAHPNIHIFEYHYAVDLITEHHLGQYVSRLRPDIHCFGAYVLDERADVVHTFLAKATLLATGGSGQVYLHTTNPLVATGDGVAMAYRAKARVANMEFIQFHPTTLFDPEGTEDRSFLISEAVRGEGARLYNLAGERFMLQYDRRAELAPRDIVARAIDDQLKRRGEPHVWLDISHRPAEEIKRRFPNIYQTLLRYGIDMTQQPIPVVPAAHYQCGGVLTDLHGRTTIHGLYAAGEVACTGLHGANRLASNSLLEALVFARRAAEDAIQYVQAQTWRTDVPAWDDRGTERPQEWVLISHNRDELRRIMWDYVGIVRSQLRLERALRRTRLLYEETEDFYRRARLSPGLCELRNMIAVAYLIIRSAQMRRESRGLHYMLDYPEPVESERRPTLV
ncbi:MAG: L-aspartate oxidase [Rhodothermus sp.]|nr:L-aspartate oxidase [Rhodothermus sp.]